MSGDLARVRMYLPVAVNETANDAYVKQALDMATDYLHRRGEPVDDARAARFAARILVSAAHKMGLR